MTQAHRATRSVALIASVIAMLAGTACASNEPNAPVLDAGQVIVAERGAEILLAPGQSARVASAGLLLTFAKLVGDSRCPTMATIQCVWSGSVIVDVTAAPLVGSGPTRIVRLETLNTKDTATVAGTRLQLLRVLPEKRTLDSIPLATYRIVLQAGAPN